MALFSRRRRERTIYFPWEKRGVSRALSLPGRRLRWMILGSVIALLVGWIVFRDLRRRDLRVTREAIEQARTAVDTFRADHDGKCPRDLAELTTSEGERRPYLASMPVDAWRRPLRYACPSRQPARAYDLLSDGPDGEPYGLDRIE